jgi:hypothetical protein
VSEHAAEPADPAEPVRRAPADPGARAPAGSAQAADPAGPARSAGPAESASHPPADAARTAGTTARTSAEPVGRASAVRPFLVTAGRVAGTQDGRSHPPIPVETQVVATAAGLDALGTLSFERHDIVAVCRQPQSIAEIAAKLRLHLNVVRVLAEDLRSGGHLSVHVPGTGTAQDLSVLRRVIDGLRTISDSRGNTP